MIFSIFFELLESFLPAPNIKIFLPFNKLNKYINIGKIYDKQIALDVISKYSLN